MCALENNGVHVYPVTLLCMQVASLEAANGIPGGECNQGEYGVTKKKKKKKKKKKTAENDTGEELPSSVDVSKSKENGDKIPGLTYMYMYIITEYCAMCLGDMINGGCGLLAW